MKDIKLHACFCFKDAYIILLKKKTNALLHKMRLQCTAPV